jgi:hypothetical protein
MITNALRMLVLAPAALGLAVCLHGCATSPQSASSAEAGAGRLGFDKLKPSELPEGWKADATNPQGDLAKWEVVDDEKAGAKTNLLAITEIKDNSKGHFNLCWTDRVRMKDGTLSVRIRANTGKIDQGGGLIWRVKDANNYYLARCNPLENNFRLYYVKDGKRVRLADAGGIAIKAGEWFKIKVVVNGERMEAWLDDKKLLEATDKTIPEAGGVGLWSKADAASSFDDFVCQTQK